MCNLNSGLAAIVVNPGRLTRHQPGISGSVSKPVDCIAVTPMQYFITRPLSDEGVIAHLAFQLICTGYMHTEIVNGLENNNNNNNNNDNGPNGHLFYVGGDLMMRRGMLPIIMLPDGDLRIVLHLVPFWILTIWGSVHIGREDIWNW